MCMSYTQCLPKTITPGAGLLCRYRIQADDLRSPRSSRHVYDDQNTACRTGTRLKKTTFCHSCIHLCRSAHQNLHLSLCYIVKGSRSNRRLADSPCCCKRHRTARANRACKHAHFLTNDP
ncbi:hypothetical protein HNY73_011465 [Argiope bruennichi]|uniref:Uncharacterized protein n=1 Tax=Argiope bruennichi TaxID=94029 RepID=A0A8T0F6W4_ARGBR|nr:hypothetical protein HNY73_011465 [Argiope bruennichi]